MTPSKKIKTTVNTRLAPFANLVELQFFYRIFVQPKILVFVSRKRRKARERWQKWQKNDIELKNINIK